MKTWRRIIAGAAGMVIALCAVAAGAEPTGAEIVKRLNELGSVKDITAELEMRLIHQSGAERTRQLSLASKQGAGGAQQMLLRFMAPADVRGTAFLSISRPGAEDESWIYLPALGKPRRIAAGEQNSSFMGSDFTYADMGLFETDDYRHTLLRRETLGGEEVYVVKSTPLSDQVQKKCGFAVKTWWIRTENYTVAKAEFADGAGRVFKALSGGDVVKLSAGAWFTTRMEMRNRQSGSRTVVTFKNIKTNTGLNDGYFTVRQLTRVVN